MQFSIEVANHSHYHHAEAICDMIQDAAKKRGTGIAKRTTEYVQQKMEEGKAVIALDGKKPIGFCYIESWEDEKYVANSGLIIHPDYRKKGLATAIKKAIFDLSRIKFPKAKLFGITTSMAVMKINSKLGYKPVTFSELTKDEKFWAGCSSCANFDILTRTNKSMCLCTGMVCHPNEEKETPKKEKAKTNTWESFKQFAKTKTSKIETLAKAFPKRLKSNS